MKAAQSHLEVAILGGGFTGVYCAKALVKSLGKKRAANCGLIADENYLVFQPMLPEVAGAALNPGFVVNPIRTMARGLQVYRGTITTIDFKNKRLTLDAGSFSQNIEVTYDHLVLAMGATIDLSRVPGMPEHAYLMQNVGDAMKLRATALSRFEEANLQADPQLRKRMLSFAVVGGGYSGVETAGQLLDLFASIHKFYTNIGPDDFRVCLIHSRDHLLPTLSKSLGKYAEKKLVQRGLELFMEKRVKAVTANYVYLDDGTQIETSLVISTVGNAPHPLVLQLCRDLDIPHDKGRIITLDTMAVAGHEGLWAAGDCAAVPIVEGGFCPPTAQFAMRQGDLLGENIGDLLKGTGEPLAFTFRGLGELASIGHRTAVANILGLHFSGFIAWWMWRSVYLMKLPGLDRKLRVMLEWTLDLFFPKDINLINPRFSQSLKDVYLEPGNILFNAGEPSFSFYVLKDGQIDIMDGDTLIKSIRPGEFFGERALLGDKQWRYTAIAQTPSRLISLGLQEFQAVMTSSEPFRHLLAHTSQTYQTTEDLNTLKRAVPRPLLIAPMESVMKTDPLHMTPDLTVRDALTLMKQGRHSFYPVCNEEKQALGVFRRDDIYEYILKKEVTKDSTLGGLQVIYMPQVHPDQSVEQVIEIMVRKGSNKVLVTENKRLVGIFSIMDILDQMEFLDQQSN